MDRSEATGNVVPLWCVSAGRVRRVGPVSQSHLYGSCVSEPSLRELRVVPNLDSGGWHIGSLQLPQRGHCLRYGVGAWCEKRVKSSKAQREACAELKSTARSVCRAQKHSEKRVKSSKAQREACEELKSTARSVCRAQKHSEKRVQSSKAQREACAELKSTARSV
jgi:hypothetical protein